ncbi:MAG TPA: protease modulator HflC [Phenylobacterium sp.]|jgi:membrane protease subunit HflC|uniref:protease modulator HflC n=1 Tax=Phenylobacterium sp. TaxID=1871053 RepID=UPI002BAEE06C|nr:protease modulator HflC [Phenylobacterium sp.]HXA39678.1 protease modulator HflC [Phenylobacterium sp.]
MSRSTPLFLWLILGFVALIVVANTLFVVDQREEALVLRFGEPVRVIHAPGQPGAGLNIKQPFVENVIKFDRRNLALEADQEEIIDADQQRLVVDAFLRYRISDPLQYYRTLRNEQIAQDRLERLVNSSLRQVLGSTTQSDIISARRDQLMQQSKLDVARRAKESRLGIEVIDLRIKRADLPEANRVSVYRRMQTQRQQQAAQIRAHGEQQKREIIATADKQVAITLADAQQIGETTRGEGDALRTRIFAQAYGKDPSFAAFYRSMLAYEAGLGQGDTTLVLSPDSAFFKYFEQGPNAGAGGAKR